MICQRCNQPMKKVRTSEYGPKLVEIDWCRYCNGRWLDGGEWETLTSQIEKRAKGDKP